MSPPNWELVGYVSNEKPSVVFKISGLNKENTNELFPFGQLPISHHAQVGISMESTTIASPLISQLEAKKPQKQSLFIEFTQKMLQHFIDFTSNTCQTSSLGFTKPSESYIPLTVVQAWYQNFQNKFAANPNFWQ